MRIAKTFRLSETAINHLTTLEHLTGASKTSLVEQALALYCVQLRRDFEKQGKWLELPYTAKPISPSPKTAEQAVDPYSYLLRGRLVRFSFAVAELPKRGSEPCPCGSGQPFMRCHSKEFRLAVSCELAARR